jgi:hypothetical protein
MPLNIHTRKQKRGRVMSFEAPPLPREKKSMIRDSEEKERNNPVNMSDHDIQKESYNLAVQRNNNFSAFTKEQAARSQELFEESSNRTFERVHGYRPAQQQQQPPTITPSPISPSTTTQTEIQAKRVLDFVNNINPHYKKHGVIVPREKQEV